MLKLFLMLLLPLTLASCSREEPPPPSSDALALTLQRLADQAKPGTLGVAILDLQTGRMHGINADKPMPMQSVFKLPLGIFVFHRAAEGAFSLDEKITLTEDDITPLYSPITDRFAEKKDYTIGELVEVTVAQSDNAAADLLMKRTGGPEALTRFLQERGFEDFRVDRYEYELQPQSTGLPPIKPRMTREDYSAVREAVPLGQQKAAMTLYLADPRDRMSPATAVRMLAALDAGKLLPPDLTQRMMTILKGTTSGPARLKAGIPEGATIHHKTGTGASVERVNGATNDIGIIELADGRKFAVAAFLAGSELSSEGREKLIADVARIAAATLAPRANVP